MGNICRSPAGEAILQHQVQERGLAEQFEIDSAGTHGYHIGELADARMRRTGERRGYQFLSRSRKLIVEDLERFHLVIPMDYDNLVRTRALDENPQANIKLLSDFLGDDWPDYVPDPYYGGRKGFEFVLEMIEAACPGIIEFFIPSPA